MSSSAMAHRAAAVRRFNRFYTRQIGVLAEHYLQSPFSLTEARVIYELAQHDATTASALGATLNLDASYLSRILRSFGTQGLLTKQRSPTDGRQSLLRLTEQGRAAYGALNAHSQADFEALLGRLPEPAQQRLITAMAAIEGLLGAAAQPATLVLRPHQPGDLGWVVQRHGALYAEEYGWDIQFEALVAEIVAAFLQHFDSQRERCWIAELDGVPVGSVFVVKQSDAVAKLRLLLVEPQARGRGIGARLVDECLRFARQAGYARMTLWTNRNLHAARLLYERAGFELVHSEPHHSFGHDLVGETWERDL